MRRSLKQAGLLIAACALGAQIAAAQEGPLPASAPTPAIDIASIERSAYNTLDDFVGTWKGTLILTNEQGDILRLVPINQSYWWDGRILKGLATYGNETRIEYVFSDTSVERGSIISVIKEGTRSKVMEATATPDGLVWTPRDPTRVGSEQAVEQITQAEGQDILMIRGFERVTNPPLEQRILIHAELIRQPEETLSEKSE